jgi:hypothetical protein
MRSMLANIPLMVIPFIVYNVFALGLFGGGPDGNDIWQSVILSVNMISGAQWKMTLGDLLITFALLLLFVEIMKSTRIGASSIIDHLLSTFVFVAFLVEFLLVPSAAHAVFFILMIITLVDVIAGFSVSIRSASRDVSVGGGY